MGIDRVCAVIVIYRAEAGSLEALVRRLRECVAHLVVVDNGSPGIDPGRLKSLHPSLQYKPLAANAGIAAAQNTGIGAAAAAGADYVLFLDQDSKPEEEMVPRLLRAMEVLSGGGARVACVGPQLRLPGSRELSFFPKAGWGGLVAVRCTRDARAIECEYLISSGTLVPIAVFDQVGNLEEGLFIDKVDTEWCYRARSKGFRMFGICGAVLEHDLGLERHRIWLGRWRQVPRHSPLRYYYIFRNTVLLSRRAYVPVSWSLFQYAWLVVLFLVFGIFGGRRSSGGLALMVKGLKHGFRGVAGQYGG
jgi:rhamnosyltransferase